MSILFGLHGMTALYEVSNLYQQHINMSNEYTVGRFLLHWVVISGFTLGAFNSRIQHEEPDGDSINVNFNGSVKPQNLFVAKLKAYIINLSKSLRIRANFRTFYNYSSLFLRQINY
jgi:hypothetical protein